MRKAVLLGLVVAGLGVLLLVRSHLGDAPDDAPPATPPPAARSQPETGQRAVVSPAPSVPPLSAAKEPAASAPTGWMRESDLRPKGFATPRDAYESFLYASTGGDVNGTARAIYLTEEARQRAAILLANLSPAKRAEYGTPERLIASLYVASSALMGAKPSGESSYQIISDDAGIGGLDPQALGLSPSPGSDSAYRTVRSKTRSAGGTESEPVAVFVQTEEGWKWMMPPGTVDALGRLFKAAGSKH